MSAAGTTVVSAHNALFFLPDSDVGTAPAVATGIELLAGYLAIRIEVPIQNLQHYCRSV
jgi:hypothetical protein